MKFILFILMTLFINLNTFANDGGGGHGRTQKFTTFYGHSGGGVGLLEINNFKGGSGGGVGLCSGGSGGPKSITGAGGGGPRGAGGN